MIQHMLLLAVLTMLSRPTITITLPYHRRPGPYTTTNHISSDCYTLQHIKAHNALRTKHTSPLETSPTERKHCTYPSAPPPESFPRALWLVVQPRRQALEVGCARICISSADMALPTSGVFDCRESYRALFAARMNEGVSGGLYVG